MACILLLPLTNRHVTAPRFDLMARILLHDEHEYGSWYLTTVLPTCTVTALRTDKTSRRYACETTPITRRADTPTTPSLASYCYLNRQASCRYAYETTRRWHRTATYPNRQASCRYAYETTLSLASYCYPNRQASCRYAYKPNTTR